jgi:outer membrane protein OmpA-like peptidoglycan-associated protein
MKNIQHSIAATVFFLLFLSLSAYGQKPLEECVDFRLTQARRDLNNLVLQGTVNLKAVNVSSKNQLTISPILEGKDEQILNLPQIIVNGKARHKLYNRMVKLNKNQGDTKPFLVLVAGDKKLSSPITYRATVPYQTWMKGSSMFVLADLCGCAGSTKDDARLSLGPSANLEQYGPQPNFVAPPREAIKKRAETGEAFLIFQQSKWEILPNLYNNKEELNKIDRSLRYIYEEPTATITGITIKAYASPEGIYDFNITLSKNRAKALLDYVKQKYTIPSTVRVFSEGYGEDWDRLVTMLEKDYKVEKRSQVLQIIRTVSNNETRKTQIKALDGSRTWNYLLEYLYPFLRRADYQIEYSVPEFSKEKSMQMLDTKPNMLSLEELYRLADDYEKGSERYNRIYKLAGKTFPDDPIACTNAAAISIQENDYAEAKMFLKNWLNANDPATWNNLAILCMSELRLDEAERYLLKARPAGVREAATNLNILQEMRQSVEVFEIFGN